MDPRSAGELLSRSKKPPTRLADADRSRAMALYARALTNQDSELGTLLNSLRASKRDEDTMVIVTGDVAMNEVSPTPFSEGDVSDEATLTLPLVVRNPGSPSGVRIKSPTESADIATTILTAFGLTLPRDFIGFDLANVALEPSRYEGRVLVSEGEGKFSVRRGALVLVGAGDRDLRLCDLSLEPACVTDVRATYPLAYEGLRSNAFELLYNRQGVRAREPAPIDSATASALHLWGR